MGRTRSITRIFAACLLAVAGTAGAQPPSVDELRRIVVQAEFPECFTQQEAVWVLRIPGVSPDDVQTDLQELPPGARFVASKRGEFMDARGGRGTEIEFTFTFAHAGAVQLPPLVTRIGRRTYSLAFSPVTVRENPAQLAPVLSVEFSPGVPGVGAGNGARNFSVTVGTEIEFTVYLQYSVQTLQFKWALPRDSIFVERERYAAAARDSRRPDVTAERFPLARFSWRPLTEGTFPFPHIAAEAISYTGEKRTVTLPAYAVTVLAPAQDSRDSAGGFAGNGENPWDSARADSARSGSVTGANGNPQDSMRADSAGFPARAADGHGGAAVLLAQAFAESDAGAGAESAGAAREVPAELYAAVAARRSEERHSFPWRRAVGVARAEAETAALMLPGEREPSIPVFAVCAVGVAVCAAGVAVAATLRRWRAAALGAFLAVVLVPLALSQGARVRVRCGICAGGTVGAVPEEHSAAARPAPGGVRVKILERTAGWVYVESRDVNGWIRAADIYEIR